VFAALLFLGVVICGYLFGWKWTGLPKRSFWDWLDLLIVPVVLAIGGYLFTRFENKATQAAAERRAQEEALQAYLEQMGQLLLDKDPPLRKSEKDSEVRTLARARTLTVLARLDGDYKARVVQFLYESGLITKDRVVDLNGAPLSGAILSGAILMGADLSWANLSEADLRANLSGANLEGASLSKASLRNANLSGASLRNANLSDADLWKAELRGVDLRGADLSGVNLRNADLGEAILSGADLSGVNLFEANLREANLNGAFLSGAFLSGAFLSRADLREADLREADLREADLREADLTGAIVSDGQLDQAQSLKGATMPNGQKYEDWLKGKESRG